MTDDEKKYWVGFSAFPGIGPLRFKLLLDYFGTAKNAWLSSYSELVKIGLGEKLSHKFVEFKNNFSPEQNLRECGQKKIQIITLSDKNYPKLLKEIPAAPFVLYIRGNYDRINSEYDLEKSVAVVGTRQITGYGREVTAQITQGLIEAGLIVVSGLAYGVDAVAHQTAVENNGQTIAVLGCGVDIIYPAANTTLYWQIVKKNGLVMSEFPPGRLTEKGLFPSRNRIISGLSLGVVVTEGASDSGALITARYAAEQGREVFAVPGPITSSLSKGPTILLKQGAKMVTEVKDILEELKINPKSKIQMTNQIPASPAGRQNSNNQKILNKEEIKILQLLQNENLHFDEIAGKSGISPDKLGGLLTMMEMKGFLKNLGSGIYGTNRVSP